jgi:hypothetical protein
LHELCKLYQIMLDKFLSFLRVITPCEKKSTSQNQLIQLSTSLCLGALHIYLVNYSFFKG